MSTSPRPPGRSRRLARAAFFVAAVLVAVSSTTAIAGLEPVTGVIAATSPGSGRPIAAQNARIDAPIPSDPCSPYYADFCVEVPLPTPTPIVTGVPSCTLAGAHQPTGALGSVAGTDGDVGAANAVRIRVEVETGLAIEEKCFADAALWILRDDRGWSDIDGVTFVRVDDESYDLRLVLASPTTTDAMCYPANTAGKYSCRNRESVIINLMRWESGTDEYIGDLTTYRRYLINHEVGHFLGKGHLRCPAAGEAAPVMMQQTKGLGECLPNGWPTKDEH